MSVCDLACPHPCRGVRFVWPPECSLAVRQALTFMVDGVLGKQIPVGEMSVELAMPGNLTKDLGHGRSDAPDFAEVLLGSLHNAEGTGANALPPIHPRLARVEDSLPDSLSASLALALSRPALVAHPIRQLLAAHPLTQSLPP